MTTPPRTHDPAVPLGSIVFGYGPMLPLVAAGVGAWLMPPPWPELAARLGIAWGGLILVFVAGVRRGYAFDNPDVPAGSAIGAMIAFFLPGAGAVLLGLVDRAVPALALLVLGYALVAILDPRAARLRHAPAHFARLRAPQMTLAVLGLGAVLLRVLTAA